ncbi:MAG: hypothetical protein Q9166_007721 [cf. Caloplaca sp. 2 TL-2023]
MSKYPSLQIHPGRSLGFLILGASLHDVLTRLKAQPHLYPTIDVSYAPAQPLVAPVILNLPANGFRLRFDGPDQRLRLIEILDFGKTQLSYKNIDLIKLPEEKATTTPNVGQPSQHGPVFRYVYNRLMGPTFPGEYLAPSESASSQNGLYVLSYPGIAFTFPLQHSAWSPNADFVSLLSSSAAAPAKSLAIFNGASWQEARQDLFTRPCINPRSLALSMKGKEYQPDEVDLVNVCGGGVVELLRRSSVPFRIVLGETTPQDLVAELGPPDAIYRKNDHRLSIHKPRRREQRTSHGSYGASPAKSEDFIDADHSSAHTTTDDSDVEEDADQRDDDQGQSTAKCFYNYFHHGFDVFISYPSAPSPHFPHSTASEHPSTLTRAVDHLVVTKVLLHGNIPGSYPFNRYRRSRWAIDADAAGTSSNLDSETSFSSLSKELRNVWKGNYASEQAENATQNAIVLDRDWGDSPGSSYEVLEGWEDSEQTQKRGTSTREGSGSGTTQIFGFPGMLFEVLKNDTKSWKHTLLLPKTAFPARAIIADQPQYLKKCTDDLYRRQRRRKINPEFVLHDGPPYANGPLHIGHALNKILKDITCRVQLGLGKKINYVPGWDCHGLPIEIKALEQQGKQPDAELYGPISDAYPTDTPQPLLPNHTSKNPIAIRNAARQLAADAFAEQKATFRQWGIMADWDKAWTTMDKEFELRQLKVFSNMVKKGLINRRFKPVYWSPSSRTALAEAELEYRDDHQSTAAYVKYAIQVSVNGKILSVFLVIWTTTPWTLPANRAIAVNSNLDYCIIDSAEHGLLVIAKDALPEAERHIGREYKVIYNAPGSSLVGKVYMDPIEYLNHGYKHPITNQGPNGKLRHILHADFVTASTGTGLVHLAPGHGFDDYDVCLRHDIAAFAPVDDAGCFTDLAVPGQPGTIENRAVLHGGSEEVLKLFQELGCLVKQHTIVHRYPYDWRTKKPVIIRATEQWFADVVQVQSDALRSLDKVKFVPGSGKDRLSSFVKSRKEWCISRQRAWGVPIPALYHVDTGNAVLTPESVEHIISEIRTRGIDAWWLDESTDSRWVSPGLNAVYGTSKFRRGVDTMDVWFDSGTSWTQMQKRLPADVYLEGNDQHRGWFQSSLLTYIAQQTASVSSSGVTQAPFKTLITHGFVLDSQGRKMSKSEGNVTSPDEIMAGTLLPPAKGGKPDAMGPDALRLWVAMSDYTSDVKVNPQVLRNVHSNLTKFRNTCKWILSGLRDFDGPITPSEGLQSPHRMALLQLANTVENVRRNYEQGEYNKVISALNKYVVNDLSGFYFMIVKDALYADRGNHRWQVQFTLLHIYQYLSSMLAPVTPLLVEEVWRYTSPYVKENVSHPLQGEWSNDALKGFQDDQLAEDINLIGKARTAVHAAQERARNDGLMGNSLESNVIVQVETPESCFTRHRSDLAVIFDVSRTDLHIGRSPLDTSIAEWVRSEEFDVEGMKVTIHVCKASEAKCGRCWRWLASPDASADEALCDRCKVIVNEMEAAPASVSG